MNRQRARSKCSCGKNLFTTRKRATKAMVRAGAERVYWCPEGGGYHITRYSKAENESRFQQQMQRMIAASDEAGTQSRRVS